MKETISFGGGNPRMKEVPPGTEAVFRFKGDPGIVDTEWGDKYSFPILLISHESHPLLKEGPQTMLWDSKSACAKQLYDAYWTDVSPKKNTVLHKAYKNEKWALARFENGVYHISVA